MPISRAQLQPTNSIDLLLLLMDSAQKFSSTLPRCKFYSRMVCFRRLSHGRFQFCLGQEVGRGLHGKDDGFVYQ